MDIFSKKKKNDNSFDEGFKFAFFSFFPFFNATLLSSSREISLVNGDEALRNRRYGHRQHGNPRAGEIKFADA